MEKNLQNDEHLDIVDENDNVIGRELRSESRGRADRKNLRMASGFLINSKGELWIMRRAAGKSFYPLSLDFSVSGRVASGETYERAFEREAKEELGIDLKAGDYHLLGYFSPYKDGTSCFMKIFEIKSDKAPDYNKEDFCEAFWILPGELVKKIEAGEEGKVDLLKLVKYFYIS